MTDPTRPATGYPAHPTNGYPSHQQQPPPQSNNYYYPNYNPQPYYIAPPPPRPRATIFRRLFSVLIATFVIFGAILFIIYLVLRPRVPIFTLTSFSLSSLNVTSTSTTSSYISAACTANFTVSNPNKKLHVHYDQIVARLFYKTSFLTQNELPPFDQAVRNQTVYVASLVATSAYITPDDAKKLDEDRGKGEVKFDLQMIAIVWFDRGGWSGRKRYLRVLCDDLPVGITAKSSNGGLIGGSRRCAVVI